MTTKEIRTDVQPAIFNAVDREAKKAGLILFGKHDARGDHFRFAFSMTDFASDWIPGKTYAIAWVAGFQASRREALKAGLNAVLRLAFKHKVQYWLDAPGTDAEKLSKIVSICWNALGDEK